ncbi:Protein of unknown function [Lactobacillus helveticus CIRM-BIA 951]|nr:Protein of unknown function [Lactobacillus helveticus CIRM-BIA 953]CDI58218.1 Protein of unknown function [Lactobacillus helveticus CIRM-BIA 951]
MRLKDY